MVDKHQWKVCKGQPPLSIHFHSSNFYGILLNKGLAKIDSQKELT